MKKFLSIFMLLVIFISYPAYAEDFNLNNEDILNPITITDWDYKIYNEDGELVETGTLKKHKDGEITPRYAEYGITLKNGHIAELRPAGSNGFYFNKGATFRVAYDLDRTAWAICEVRETYGSTIYSVEQRRSWHAGGSIIENTTHHVATLTNTDADTFTIKEFSITTF